jgi:ParB/RepB/Spo0J family partition protein
MNKTETEKIHVLLLADIAPSATQPRKDFKQSALEEMAASIQHRGVVQPVIVRPVACIENEEHRKAAGKALYELIAGERRCRGSKLAGKKDIPAVIRELSDMAALEVQVIENAQRQDLDHLEEGDSYDRLLKSGQITVEELSAKIGKSRATIYGRIKLLDAPDTAKEAYRAGKLSAQVLLLIARIPNRKVADEATERILKGQHGEPMSFRQVQTMIASDYMTQLKGAPFDPKDAALVPDAGPCAACPKRSGNQKELFADVGRADVCTDPVCFRLKCDAARARLMAQAESEGKMVLSPQDSQALFPHSNYLSHDAPVVELSKLCPFASGKTWQELVDELPEAERPSVIVAVDRDGQLHELIGKKEAGEVARALELATPGQTRGDLSPAAVHQRQQIKDARERGEQTTRTVNLVIDAILAKQAKAKDNKALARLLLVIALHEAHFDTCRRVNVRHGFTSVKKDGEPRQYHRARAKDAENDPLPFALETLLWECGMFASGLPDTIIEAAKIYGVDLAKIKAEAKKKPAKADVSAKADASAKAAPKK